MQKSDNLPLGSMISMEPQAMELNVLARSIANQASSDGVLPIDIFESDSVQINMEPTHIVIPTERANFV